MFYSWCMIKQEKKKAPEGGTQVIFRTVISQIPWRNHFKGLVHPKMNILESCHSKPAWLYLSQFQKKNFGPPLILYCMDKTHITHNIQNKLCIPQKKSWLVMDSNDGESDKQCHRFFLTSNESLVQLFPPFYKLITDFPLEHWLRGPKPVISERKKYSGKIELRVFIYNILLTSPYIYHQCF